MLSRLGSDAMKPMDQKQFARHLRHCQNTYESPLWQLLRNRRRCNQKFRRQHPIGIYTADFFCDEEILVVEIDVRDHFTEQGALHDEARDRLMIAQGIRVLRLTGKQVELETDWGLAQIDQTLASSSTSASSPAPFPPEYRREGE